MSEKINIALVQADLKWNDPASNRSHLANLLKGVSADIIVLPELFTTGFCMKGESELIMGESMQWMIKICQKMNAVVCGSLIINVKGKRYNRFIWMNPDSSFEYYNKRHLFSLLEEENYFIPGKERKIISHKGWSIFPQICYDLRFPVFSRNNKGYDLLLYVANWPQGRISAWDKLLQARAIENQSYTVGVNRVGKDSQGIVFSGHSAVYDALGDSCVFLGTQEKVETVTLEKSKQEGIRKKYPFLQDKDSFILSK